MSKSNYYIQVLSEAKGNGKIIWKQLNSLLNPKGNTTQNMNLKLVKTLLLIVHKLQTNSINDLYNVLTTSRQAFQAGTI